MSTNPFPEQTAPIMTDADRTTRFDTRRVVVAMSGGVDSSVAAWLLKKAGYSVMGATLRLHGRAGKAIDDAASVCRQLGIDHHVLDLRDRFDEQVQKPFVLEYLNGRTPNPCIFCNPALKFQAMLELADQLEAGSIATGHYVRVTRHLRTGRLALARAASGNKDQSYFLYRLTQEQLGRLRLPIADLEKSQVRELAREAGLVGADNGWLGDQPDSQDICFIESDYPAFLRDYTRCHPMLKEAADRMGEKGPVVLPDGKPIGRHFGLMHYTPGQRKGFETQSIDRLYVLAAEPKTNTLIVGSREDAASNRFVVENLVFSGFSAVDPGIRLDCRIRNTAHAVAGFVKPMGNGQFEVTLEKPVHAPAAGQSAVFYDSDVIVFGGVISVMQGMPDSK